MKWYIPVGIFFLVLGVVVGVAIYIVHKQKCKAPFSLCNGTCVNQSNDPKNCGICARNCGSYGSPPVAKTCSAGLCVPP